jgi:hypothetical protein
MTKADCVVIDSNIWRSELLLRTAICETLIYTLRMQQGFIGLPEVIEKELRGQVQEALSEAMENYQHGSRVLSTLLDFTALTLPSCTPDELVAGRLNDLEPILVRVPFILDHARAALEMVLKKEPPNGPKHQQYKDSAIWQSVVQLGQKYRVQFITSDNGFRQNRNEKCNDLARNLRDECSRSQSEVTLFADVGSCLQSITKDTTDFDADRFISIVFPAIYSSLNSEGRKNGFDCGRLLRGRCKAFQTQVANQLAVDYEVYIEVFADRSDDRINLQAIVHGSGYYDKLTNVVKGHVIDDASFTWSYSHGGHGCIARGFDNPRITPKPSDYWST